MTLAVVDLHETPAGGELHPLRFTVAQFHALDEAGLLPSDRPVELLDGIILEVDRGSAQEPGMNVSARHTIIVNGLFLMLADKLKGSGWHPRGQASLALRETTELIPDAAIARGNNADYQAHPRPADLCLVVEVSDTSLRYDRGQKLAAYARSGVTTVWIINLPEQQVECYTHPNSSRGTYRTQTNYAGQEVIALPEPLETITLTVDQILSARF